MKQSSPVIYQSITGFYPAKGLTKNNDLKIMEVNIMSRRKYTYDDVNKAIKNVMGYMNSIENIWNKTRNLKLYDVFFNCEKIVSKYPLLKDSGRDVFYDFCDIQYRSFEEEIENGYIEDRRVYIGRTSSFYITDLNDKTPVYVLYNLLNEVAGFNIYDTFDFNDDLTVKPFESDYFTQEELLEQYGGDMEYLVKEFIYDVKEFMNSAIELAKYLDDFQKNQIEYFEEYCEEEENYLQYEKEEEKKREIESKNDFGIWTISYAI